jgi:hypothetical protein
METRMKPKYARANSNPHRIDAFRTALAQQSAVNSAKRGELLWIGLKGEMHCGKGQRLSANVVRSQRSILKVGRKTYTFEGETEREEGKGLEVAVKYGKHVYELRAEGSTVGELL